ncbi:TadE/TadG family type IV pilus assembly protein [Agrococcus sp. SGAir0287]|uniref:TadE/TadG family type IV pilus assembly protein n=1 Tax=Agrococcus sp. SGAir0287 TaxID=2070347 RepID=UPI0010CCCBFC|nr:TadE/TadG family type IV pilus assembly protein [Agrococcus sp. SGAir0287]QCR18922.1 pilus assembly protein TadE [Agrococcus sp. SGAir0287]
MRRLRALGDDRGSAVAETAMVVGLLTLVVLSVMQLALGLHVRNVLQDAAAEGARYGALAGSSPAAGIARAQALVETAVGADYAQSVTATTTTVGGHPALRLTIEAPLPILGLVGPTTLEVHGSAALETLE